MNHFKIILSYRGTHYSGWQAQSKNPNTIQNELTKVLRKVFNGTEFKLSAASRTDKGVHARGQVLKLSIDRDLDCQKVLLRINSKLPLDIRVISIHEIDKSFNPNMDCKSKEYRYYFSQKPLDANLSDSILYVPYRLNLSLMKEACKKLKGERNFRGLSIQGSRSVIPMRNILHCTIQKANLDEYGDDIYYLRIIGDGFLKYMVRFIMQSLIYIAQDKILIKDLEKSLKDGSEIKSKKKAPALGLHLIKINY